MPTRVAVATSADHPNLDLDGPLLLGALRGAGLVPEVVVWDGEHDWSSYAAVLIRSTWDYTGRVQEFLAWAGAQPRLINPAGMVAWNVDKHYLGELAAAGLATVPTLLVEPGSPAELPAAVDTVWDSCDEIVVKPTISASASDTGRFRRDDPDAVALLAAILASGRAAMVQPYLADVDEAGEASLVYFAGEFSHAARKAPILLPTSGGDRTGDPLDDETLDDVRPCAPSPAERELADRVVATVTRRFGAPTYARIDMLPSADGPVVLEVELVEPALWLGTSAGSADRFAAAVRAAVLR